jgi:FkbH-like protein
MNDALLKDALAAGEALPLRAALRDILLGSCTLADLAKWQRLLGRNRPLLESLFPEAAVRVAILGGYTTQPVALLLAPVFLSLGVRAEIYESAYNTFRQEILDPESGLYRFRPDLVLLVTGDGNVEAWPQAGDSDTECETLLERQRAEWSRLWKTVRSRTAARIWQHNFAEPADSDLGRLERRHRWSRHAHLDGLNRFFDGEAGTIEVVDIEGLSRRVGAWNWFDPRWYHHGKYGFNPKHVADYGRLLLGLARAVYRSPCKVLALDLDNTLWGGLIGEDGLDGIELGESGPRGEAFSALSAYLLRLRKRGVLLAVNSRNQQETAAEVFSGHPGMPLKRGDFAAFICNWESKAENLRVIARQLNVGLDAIAFVDDDPAQCAEIRALLPEVLAVPMPEDPAALPRRLDEMRIFDTLSITGDDIRRQASVLAREKLLQAPSDGDDYAGFMRGLGMRGEMRAVREEEQARVEQLFGKTNQFNLTGLRYDMAALRARAGDPDLFCWGAWLEDAYAHHGLVAALCARREGAVLRVENWVMSCRVFSRTFEDFILNALTEEARRLECAEITGTFVPTGRNAYAGAWLEKRALLSKESGAGPVDWSHSVSGENLSTHVRGEALAPP